MTKIIHSQSGGHKHSEGSEQFQQRAASESQATGPALCLDATHISLFFPTAMGLHSERGAALLACEGARCNAGCMDLMEINSFGGDSYAVCCRASTLHACWWCAGDQQPAILLQTLLWVRFNE